MSIQFAMQATPEHIVLRVTPEKVGLFGRLRKQSALDLKQLPREERAVALALARLRSLDAAGAGWRLAGDRIELSHLLAAQLDDVYARAIGLPPALSGFTFAIRMEGTLGSSDAKFVWRWEEHGRSVNLPRVGAILFPEAPARRMRLPHAIFAAIVLAADFNPIAPLPEHWSALARLRNLLGADVEAVSLDAFLEGIRIATVASIGLWIDADDESVFSPLPFAADRESAEDLPGVAEAAVQGAELKRFQDAVGRYGARPSYRVGDGAFVVVDRSAMPILNTIAEHMGGDAVKRRFFLDNAARLAAAAVEAQLREDGELHDGMSPEAQTELIERRTGEGWTETSAWSARVLGVGLALRAAAEISAGSGANWLPATVDENLGALLGALPDSDIEPVLKAIMQAIAAGAPAVRHEVGDIPASLVVAEALRRRLALLKPPSEEPPSDTQSDAYLPITHENFWDLEYAEGAHPRAGPEPVLPERVTTDLRPYQAAAFLWQANAWRAGLPGLLNADEQGLGKTLQTLAFCAWLQDRMDARETAAGPVLIVAPTSLLRNWEDEIERHLGKEALGPIHKLFGPELTRWKRRDFSGRDIGDGQEHLDLAPLENSAGIAITTYQTLANYAVSFAKLRCAAVVFDEIQFLKNPRTQRARAAKALHANFRVGLTGTPVENATRDIWALADILWPGALGALAGFRRLYDAPSPQRLAILHSALFGRQGGRLPLCQRRLKADVAADLPPKTRVFHPREMPRAQQIRYDEARAKTGGILQVLGHIRRISAHPGLIEGERANDFAGASARTAAVMDILAHIKARGERALVFVENRDIQAWLAELIKLEFELDEVAVINGDTSIDDRKAITDHFQRVRDKVREFDVLLLGPRAAGTGLTLTAANHVIHLTRWWNPAVEEQCNDRTHRIGQTRPVTIHIPLAVHPDLGAGTFDCLLQRLMKRKRKLAAEVLSPTSVDDADIRRLYEGVRSGEALPPETEAGDFDGALEGRGDLVVDALSANLLRVRLKTGGAAVLVGSDNSPDAISDSIADDDAAAILLTAHDPADLSLSWRPITPLSVVRRRELWPDYILPE